MQVPEGSYSVALEPNTPYHLALRLNYPNEFDIAQAVADGRKDPGSDILIHGTTGSVGCIAVGDQASEDLFVLVHDTGKKVAPLYISPVDFRTTRLSEAHLAGPAWVKALYAQLASSLEKFPQAD